MPTLALSTGSLHNYGLNRVWGFAAEAGFDAIEVMIDAKWDTRQGAYLRSLVADFGLPIAALHTPFRPIHGFGEDYPACVRQALALAFPHTPQVEGDLFGGVAAGLAVSAAHYS